MGLRVSGVAGLNLGEKEIVIVNFLSHAVFSADFNFVITSG
jgi:hypothetical protein